MDPSLRTALQDVTTATLTTVMLKRGIRTTWLKGTMPYATADKRIVGPAFTMRFIPAREDLATPEACKSPKSTRAAIEEMPEECVCVVDARGIDTAGVFGDILTLRMKKTWRDWGGDRWCDAGFHGRESDGLADLVQWNRGASSDCDDGFCGLAGTDWMWRYSRISG